MNGENKALAVAELELGGVNRKIEFSLYSIAKLKKVTGKNVLVGELDVKDPDNLTLFIWAALISHDATLDGGVSDGGPDSKLAATLEQIGRWVPFSRMQEITEAINTAFLAAMPSEKKGGAEKKSH